MNPLCFIKASLLTAGSAVKPTLSMLLDIGAETLSFRNVQIEAPRRPGLPGLRRRSRIRWSILKTPVGLPVYSLQHQLTLSFLFFGGARFRDKHLSNQRQRAPPKNKRKFLVVRRSINRQPVTGFEGRSPIAK
jgi:hypothetical protein